MNQDSSRSHSPSLPTGDITDEEAHKILQRALRQPGQIISLPLDRQAHECYVPTLTTRVLRTVTYVIVIITCLAALYTMYETWTFLQALQEAMQEWSDSFTGNLLGE